MGERSKLVTGPYGDNPITDEQIRELWADALDSGDRDLVRIVQLARGFWRCPTEHLADDQAATERREALVECAAAWNARHGAKP